MLKESTVIFPIFEIIKLRAFSIIINNSNLNIETGLQF